VQHVSITGVIITSTNSEIDSEKTIEISAFMYDPLALYGASIGIPTAQQPAAVSHSSAFPSGQAVL